MIGPDKYVTVEQSLIGMGAKIIRLLQFSSANVSDLWKRYRLETTEDENFQRFIAAIDLLYMTSAIDVARDGVTLTLKQP
jgi:hypothetical protein